MGASAEPVSVEKDASSHAHAAPNASQTLDHHPSSDAGSRVLTAADSSPHSAAELISHTGSNPSILQRSQRSYGNRASQQIVMRARAIQRKCDCGGACAKCQEEEQQQKALQRSSLSQSVPAVDDIPSTQGEPLATETIHSLESHFQADLSGVRVHINTEAAQSAVNLDAHAYTAGRDIYFAPNMYAPSTTDGQRLLAHEVAHVVQQGAGKEPALATKSAHGVKIGAPDDVLETEADQAAESFLRADISQSEDQKRNVLPFPSNEHRTVLRQPATAVPPLDQSRAQDSAPTIVDAVLGDDIAAVVALLRHRSIAELVSLRNAVASRNIKLERWFIGKRINLDQKRRSQQIQAATSMGVSVVVDLVASAFEDAPQKPKVDVGALAEEGLRWLWYALPLIDRLEIYDEGFREIEQAQLDTIKHASNEEKAAAKLETKRLEEIYSKMDAKEEYTARTTIDPTPAGLLDAATKLLGHADDVFWGDKDLLYNAVLALSPASRADFFDQHEETLQHVLWHNDMRDEFTLLKAMAHANEAAALIARLRLATEKRNDDMEAVQEVVDRAVALLGERRALLASKADPHISAGDREAIDKRLDEIGDVQRLLQMPRAENGKLDSSSFMGMVSAARDDPYAFGADAQRLGAFAPETSETSGTPASDTFAFQAAKQRLLLAGGDADLMAGTLLSIHAPRVQSAPGATQASIDLAQWSADVAFRKALLADSDVHDVFTSMVTSHQMHVSNSIEGDDFNEALNQLNQLRNTAQWGAFFDLVLRIAEKDAWRDRYNATSTDPFGVFAGTFGEERTIMLEILRTRHMPLIALLDYTGNVATLQTAFEHISNEDRERLREGWAISRNLVMGPLTADQENAKAVFLEFEAKVGDKLGKGSDFEDVLSAGLGSIPIAKEISTPEGRYNTAALMYERINARLALDRGVSAEFTETDETMDAAGRQFIGLWLHLQDQHALTIVDFLALSELNDTFLNRAKEFTEASHAITDLAATIAATIAGIVVVAATGGLAAPAVIALAAAAGAGTGIVTREMFGADYYRVGSDEAAKAALMDSVNGALAVVSGGLAAKGTELVGLGGKALVTGAARAAGTVAEEATVSFGRKLAASAVESAIDGFFSGAISEGFDTMLDDRTWRKGIWAGLLQAGRAAIAAGLTGMATGGVLGPATHVAGAGLSKLGQAVFSRGLDETLARAGAGELLTAAREAAQHGETGKVTRLMDEMEAHLSPEEADILRRDLNEQLANEFGHPPGTAKPRDPAQEELLHQSGLNDSGTTLKDEELAAEHYIVENSEPQISTEPGYVDEVDLGNGHTWRRAEDGTWCRFTEVSLCKTKLNVKPMSAEAQARARRFEWERRQVQAAEGEVGEIKSKAALEKQDLAEFDQIFDRAVNDARNGRKFSFKDLTPDQQAVVEQMFPLANREQLEALNLAAMERQRLSSLQGIKRLEQRVPVLEATLTSARQPLAQRLRSLPSALEDKMTRRAAGLDEFARVKPLSGRLSVEHVYPLSKIMAMKGFFELDEAEMRILANWEGNLRMTDLDANVLRRERSYSELSSLEFGKYHYTPQNLEAAAKLEREMEIELQKELDRLLAAKPNRATVQRRPAGQNSSVPSARAVAPPDDGQMLPARMRSPLEFQFRADLSDVRIHADSAAADSAQQIDAQAYTSGRDIYFAPGMYAPNTDSGQRLLVHEVAHVVQQSSGQEPAVAAKSSHCVMIGAPDDVLETEADQAAEQFASQPVPSVAPVSTRTTRDSIVQRQPQRPDYSGETFEDFKSRVRQRAITRLDQNIAALDQWRAYLQNMQAFQLRAQLLTGDIAEYAQVASQMPGGRQQFETFAGTYDPGERAYLESRLAPDASAREKGLGFMQLLGSRALGHWTTPSVAERMQVLAGDKSEADLSPSVFVPARPGYELYAPITKRFWDHEIGGCETCHEINWAWQKTIERYGTPLPELQDVDPILASPGQPYRMQGSAPGNPFQSMEDMRQIAEAMGWVDTVSAAQRNKQGLSEPAPPPSSPAPASASAEPQKNPFLPNIPLPAGVEPPIPRSNLCGALPPAQTGSSDNLFDPSLWGPNSAIAFEIIRRIGAVLQPLGPLGYRILPRQTFDQLWAAGPAETEALRADILQNLNSRQEKYRELQVDIMVGEVPYEELCPVVDELLPSTNALVAAQVQVDIAIKRAEEAVLDALLKIVGAALLLLAIFFPPSIMLSGPVIAAGVGVSLASIAVGARDYRRGSQTELSTGSHLHSKAEEDAASSLEFWGIVNIVMGLVGLLQARSLAALAPEARSAGALEDIRPGAVDPALEGKSAPAPGKGEPAGVSEPIPDPDTTAKPGDFTPEQIQSANKRLAERIGNPKSVRKVTDPELVKEYDLEVDLGEGQIYRRRTDGTWCLFRNPIYCGFKPGSAIEQTANARKVALDAELGVDTTTRLQKLREGFAKLATEDPELRALSAPERAKRLHALEEDLISEAIANMPSKPLDEATMRTLLRQHPEEVDRLLESETGWNQRRLPDEENLPEQVEATRGGSGPVEAGRVGEEFSLARSRGFGETYVGGQLQFRVQTPAGPVEPIGDLGVRTATGQPGIIESKFGPNADLTIPQARGYPLLPTQGGVPINENAIRFVRTFYPNWQPGQVVQIAVRSEFWNLDGTLNAVRSQIF